MQKLQSLRAELVGIVAKSGKAFAALFHHPSSSMMQRQGWMFVLWRRKRSRGAVRSCANPAGMETPPAKPGEHSGTRRCRHRSGQQVDGREF